jgi:hypothetical protein
LGASLEKKHLTIQRNPRGGGIDGQDLQRRLTKSRQPSDLGKVAQDLSLASREGVRESSGLGSLENRSLCGRETLVERNRDP